ncbi:esterase/lipase family protein [Streptomyces fagopyri]|uniref:esterase/lipase family protein n=1 Tax=Streptomyces fagopyri TaxID=2662397 RepID=UPI003815F5F4
MNLQRQTNVVPEVAPSTTHDAVVIVPGIMGSELVDTTTGKVLWGLANPGWLAKAWLTKAGLTALHLTQEEQAGEVGRIQPSRLLRTPAWTPFLRGIEPYTKLVRDVESVTAHPDAVLSFPYDWRLPVEFNARLLAQAARNHLEQWRKHSAHTAARGQAVDQREGQLVFIAHSMGGLVTHAALTLGGDNALSSDTRGVMTLGTPYRGSVVAASILNAIQGAPLPLPHTRLSALAAAMPGVHDLLPRFLSVEDGLEVRRLTPSDVAALGGDKDLARQSDNFFEQLFRQPLPTHRPVVGISQDTHQSMQLSNGVVLPAEHCFRSHSDGELMRDDHGRPRRFQVWGDGTVHRESASMTRRTIPLALQHGTLASSKFARRTVLDFLLEDDHLGPDQAPGALGLHAPDYVVPGTDWQLRITGTDAPAGIDCTITAVEGTWSRTGRPSASRDDALDVTLQVPDVGLYRITVEAPMSPTVLTQLVFAGPDDVTPADE